MSSAMVDAKLKIDPGDKRLTTLPTAPTAPEELDIPKSLAEDLMLRRLYTKGRSSIRELSET